MEETMIKKIWELSPKINEQESYSELTTLTKMLINQYEDQGRLEVNPFETARNRQLSLPFEELSEKLKGRICLVTGGLGYVGSALLKELLKFDLKRIYVLDNQENIGESHTLQSDKITFISCDITDSQKVSDIFIQIKPEFVFHTAAQRNPDYAESHISQTVRTNVLGTMNIAEACENSNSVKECVFSSTGKCSRYYTEEVYAASKKICEQILEYYSRKGVVRYSMVRFTHIIDNSLMDWQLQASAEKEEYVKVHSPGKFVTAQNVQEAAILMLNALKYSEDKKCNFLIVKNLEWPVESLEVALFYIKNSKRNIPVIFVGNPKGYREKFFRGQFDWNHPKDLNLLLNVYENRLSRLSQNQDMIISNICPANTHLVEKVLQNVKNISGEEETKIVLLEGLKEIFTDTLTSVDPSVTFDILKWGINPKYLNSDNLTISDFDTFVPLMVQTLKDTKYWPVIKSFL